MRLSTSVLIPLTATATAFGALAQPYLGMWELDQASSDRGEIVWAFTELGDGLWQFSSDGKPFLQFRMDLKPCATCLASEPWKAIGLNEWDTGWFGASGFTDIVTIAPDGRRLSLTSRAARRGGTPVERVRTFDRLSGDSGLAGAWRLDVDGSTSPPLIEFRPGVDDWLVFDTPGSPGSLCILLADGADYPCFSAFAAPGRTVSMTLDDARVLAVVMKQDGVVIEQWTYAVSADGVRLTKTQRSASGRTVKSVYRRKN